MSTDLTDIPSQIDVKMVSGDSKTIRVKCTDRLRNPVPLTQVTEIEWVLSKNVRGPALITKVMSADDIEVNQSGDFWYIDIILEPVDTATLKAGDYYHECQINFSNGLVNTPFTGVFSIVEDLI